MRYAPLVFLSLVPVGVMVGIGAFTFGYADGDSYLRDDPAACGNCHIMTEHLHAWRQASHRAVATCNDCHTPHTPVAKFVVKVRNGFWHSFYFTTGNHPDPIRITPANREVTEASCRYCHGELTAPIDHVPPGRPNSLSCIRCHTEVGHRVR
jgi:cytochrome c nitrite reductase small subunit